MALIPSLAEIKDLVTVDSDEYSLRVLKVKPIIAKETKRPGIMFIIGFEDEDNAKDMLHTFYFGMPTDSKETLDMMGRMLKEFLQAIGADPDNDLDEDDLIGIQFNALVDVDELNNGQIINVIKRVV